MWALGTPFAAGLTTLSRNGTTMSPAPCAEAMRKDHTATSLLPTVIPPHRGWRSRTSFDTPSTSRNAATTQRRWPNDTVVPITPTTTAITMMAAACPAASGSSARHTARRSRRCIPKATANSHPIPGLIPCRAPSSSSAAQGHTSCTTFGASWDTGMTSPEAERVGRRVTALQAHLVWQDPAVKLDEELRVERDAAVLADVELCHPAVDAGGVELRVPRRVQRIRQVDTLPVAAHLDHLRRAG